MHDEIIHISLNEVEVVSNTRSEFNEQNLKELAQSIKTNGVIQPIVVKPSPAGKYRLICGERRWRASLLAGRPDIPARVVNVPDSMILQFQIVENLQRKNVSTMDEIEAFVRLRNEQGMTEAEISKAVGKSLSHVAAQFRISRACAGLHDALGKNQITRHVALLISALDDHEKQTCAVDALKRDNPAFIVKAKDAEKWISKQFGAAPKARSRGKFAPKHHQGRFAADWKYYLLRFNPEQFEKWQGIVQGRQQLDVWMEAVETVMTGSKNHEAGDSEIDAEKWDLAWAHFCGVKESYESLRGTPGVNTGMALEFVFKPLSDRYESGERTVGLFNALFGVE